MQASSHSSAGGVPNRRSLPPRLPEGELADQAGYIFMAIGAECIAECIADCVDDLTECADDTDCDAQCMSDFDACLSGWLRALAKPSITGFADIFPGSRLEWPPLLNRRQQHPPGRR